MSPKKKKKISSDALFANFVRDLNKTFHTKRNSGRSGVASLPQASSSGVNRLIKDFDRTVSTHRIVTPKPYKPRPTTTGNSYTDFMNGIKNLSDRNAKVAETKKPSIAEPGGNALTKFMDEVQGIKKFKEHDDDEPDSLWEHVKHGGSSFVNQFNEGAKDFDRGFRKGADKAMGPLYDVGDEDDIAHQAGDATLKALDYISRPFFATTNMQREMNRKDREGGSKGVPGWIKNMPVVGNAAGAYDNMRRLTGQSPLESLDDMDWGDAKDVAKAGWRGFKGKEKPTFANVIAENAKRNPQTTIHDKRAYQIGAGLVGDLAADPLNFVGVGLVRAPIKAAKIGKQDKKIQVLANKVAEQGVKKPDSEDLYTAKEIYDAFGGSNPHRSSHLGKSRTIESSVEDIDHIRRQLRNVPKADMTKLDTISARGKRLAAKREAIQAQREARLVEHETAVLTQEMAKNIKTSEAMGDLPVGTSEVLNDTIRVAQTGKAIVAHKFHSDKVKKLQEAEASGNPEAILEARQAVLEQPDFDTMMGPVWRNAGIPPHIKETLLRDVDKMAAKDNPDYRKAMSRAYDLGAEVKKSQAALNKAAAARKDGRMSAEDYTQFRQAHGALKRASDDAWREYNERKASAFLRAADHYVKHGENAVVRDREATEELTRIKDELALMVDDGQDKAYTGMLPEDYRKMLDDEASLSEDMDEVPFSRKADLERRKAFIEREYPAGKMTPLEQRVVETPEELEGFQLADANGNLTDEADDLFEYDAEKGRYVLDPNTLANSSDEVQRWAKDVVHLINNSARRKKRSLIGRELRPIRAKREAARSEESKKLLWHEKSGYAKQNANGLTKEEVADLIRTGDRKNIRRVLKGSPIEVDLPVGTLRDYVAKSKLPRAEATEKWIDEAIAYGKSEGVDKLIGKVNSGFTKAMRKQRGRKFVVGPTKADEAKQAEVAIDETMMDYRSINGKKEKEIDALAHRYAVSEVSAKIKFNNLKADSYEDFSMTVKPDAQASMQEIKSATKSRHKQEIEDAKALDDQYNSLGSKVETLRANHAKELAALQKSYEKARETRKLLAKRIDEDVILRLVDAKVTQPGKALSLTTWGDRQVLKVPGSQSLFKATEKLGGIPIVKATRQIFADAFVPPSGYLGDELNLAKSRALGNTPQIIRDRVEDLESKLGSKQFSPATRSKDFRGLRRGVVGGDSGPELNRQFSRLIPYFSRAYDLKTGPLEISEVNRFLPKNLQVSLDKNRLPQTPQDLIAAMERGVERGNARRLKEHLAEGKPASSFKPERMPKDPMDVLWETNVAIEQALARRAMTDVINSFGVKRSRTVVPKEKRGHLGPDELEQETYELIETLGKKHGWKTVGSLGDTHYFPQESVESIERLMDLMEPENLNKFSKLADTVLKPVDEITGAWKMLATVYNPGYYTRNGVGEIMSAWFDGVVSPVPYQRALKTMKYMRNDGKDLEALKTHTPWMRHKPSTITTGKGTAARLKGGRVITHEDAVVLFHDQALKTGFINTERREQGRMGNFMEAVNSNKVTGAPRNAHKALRQFGENQEDYYRMAHFLDALGKAPTNDPVKAAEFAAAKVRKFHFDYTDFTDFEKNVMLRAFPFYKWTRKALPLMSTMLFSKPGKVMAYPKIMNAISDAAGEEPVHMDENGFMPDYGEVVPEWIRNMWGYKIAEEKGPENEETYFNLATPQMDIYKQMANPMQAASTLANPIAKTAYEQTTEEAFPGSNGMAINDDQEKIDQLMRQLPLTNFINKEIQGRGTANTRMSFGTGLGFYGADDNARMAELYNMKEDGSITKERMAELFNEINGWPAPTGPMSEQEKKERRKQRDREHLSQEEIGNRLAKRGTLRAANASEKNPFKRDYIDDIRVKPSKAHPDQETLKSGDGFTNMESPIHGEFDRSSSFGPRVHPITGRHSNHTGEDIAVPEGTPVYAPSDGVINTSMWNNVYGNQIIMGHGGVNQTMYGHLSKSNVKPGQVVRRGDIIGYVGSTGLSTGPHLHYETWVNGQPINPNKFL